MDDRLAATVEQRTSLLLQETRHSYELAWSEFERSYEGAASRIEELFAAYHEFVRLVLTRPVESDVPGGPGWETVLRIDDDHDGTLELVFNLKPISPRAAAEPPAARRDVQTADWGNPFE
jgi:hypothetical protein